MISVGLAAGVGEKGEGGEKEEEDAKAGDEQAVAPVQPAQFVFDGGLSSRRRGCAARRGG